MKKAATVIMCCAFALTMGLAGCGQSSPEGAASGSASDQSESASSQEGAASGSASDQSEGASSESAASSGSASDTTTGGSSDDAKAGYMADGYLDEFGIITAKALMELDGAELAKVAESARYTWNEKHASWTKIVSDVSPSKGLSQEEREATANDSDSTAKYEFTSEEVADLAVGGKGTPLRWTINSKAKVDNIEQVLANQQVTIVDQCEVEHRNYGRQIWAIVQNSAGDEFLLCVSYYSDMSVIHLFNADYLAHNSNGVASFFGSGEYLLKDVHTIEEAFEIIKSGQVS